MITLDTNVVSEAMKPEPHPAVLNWLNEQVLETLYLSSVTLAELLFGIAALPDSKRRDRLERAPYHSLTGLMLYLVMAYKPVLGSFTKVML